jgi:hypothetical protein
MRHYQALFSKIGNMLKKVVASDYAEVNNLDFRSIHPAGVAPLLGNPPNATALNEIESSDNLFFVHLNHSFLRYLNTTSEYRVYVSGGSLSHCRSP